MRHNKVTPFSPPAIEEEFFDATSETHNQELPDSTIIEIPHRTNGASFSDIKGLTITDVIDKMLAEIFKKHPQMRGYQNSMGNYYRMRLVMDIYENLGRNTRITKFESLTSEQFKEIGQCLVKSVKERIDVSRRANRLNLGFHSLNMATLIIFNALAYHGINALNCDLDTKDDFYASFKQQAIIPSIIAAITFVMTNSTLIQQDSGNHCAEVIFNLAVDLNKAVLGKLKVLSQEEKSRISRSIANSNSEIDKEKLQTHLDELDSKVAIFLEQDEQSEQILRAGLHKQEFHEAIRFYARFISAATIALGGIAVFDKVASLIIAKSLSKEAFCKQSGFLDDDRAEFVANFMPKLITLITSAVRNASNAKREVAFFDIAHQVSTMNNLILEILPAIDSKIKLPQMLFELTQTISIEHAKCHAHDHQEHGHGHSHHHSHEHHHEHSGELFDYARSMWRQAYGGLIWAINKINPLARIMTGDTLTEEKYKGLQDALRQDLDLSSQNRQVFAENEWYYRRNLAKIFETKLFDKENNILTLEKTGDLFLTDKPSQLVSKPLIERRIDHTTGIVETIF